MYYYRLVKYMAMTSIVTRLYVDAGGTRAASFHKQPIFTFGGKARVVKYVAKALLRQCQRCWRLDHSKCSCPRPASTAICPTCGGCHTEDAHGTNCPYRSSHSHGGQCNCTPTCSSVALPGCPKKTTLPETPLAPCGNVSVPCHLPRMTRSPPWTATL